MMPPLKFRLQNLPGRWFARAQEQEIGAALAASSVVVVTGVPGSGRKTAARAALHTRFRLCVDLGVELTEPDDMATHLAAAMAMIGPVPSVEQLVDTADARGTFVLVAQRRYSSDDFALLAAFQRYARVARIVVVSDVTLPLQVGPVVHVGDCTANERATLIAMHSVPTTMPEPVVAALGGYHVGSLVSVLEAAHHGELHQLVSSPLVQTLAVASIPVDLPTLARLLDDVEPTQVRSVALGMLHSSASGVRLAPALRDWVRAAWREGPPVALANALCLCLADNDELAYRHEAVAIALDIGEYQRAFDWLGQLPPPHLNSALAGKLARAQSPLFDKWRLRCAAEAGAFDVVRTTPRPSDIDELLVWAEGQARAGNIGTAITAANEVAAAHQAAQGDEARMLVARLRSTHGSPKEALSVLDEITDGTLRLRADALAARCWLQLGTPSAAVVIARRVALSVPAVTDHPQLQGETWLQLGALYHDLGELPLAKQMLASACAAYDGSAYFLSRVALLRRAIATDLGEPSDVPAALPADPTLHDTFSALLSAQRALAEGNAEVASMLATAVVACNRGYVGAWARTLQIRAALQCPTLPIASAFCSATHWDAIADAHLARWHIRQNQNYEPSAGTIDVAESIFANAAAGWEHAIIAGTGHAVRIAVQAYEYCCSKELALLCAEAAVGWCQALIAANAPTEAGLAALRAQAQAIRSPFFAAVSDLFAAWKGRDYVALEALRNSYDSVAVQAKFLLGESALAPWERAVFGAPLAEMKNRGIDATRWIVLDGETKTAWLDTGVVVALADKQVLWKLIAAIACADGRPTLEAISERAQRGASKEFLVETVWRNTYHPLRHDKRLQNAVHKLRHLFGETEDHRWLETRPDGYAMAEAVTVRLVKMSSNPTLSQ